MNVKQIIEQEMERNPNNWIEISSIRIEELYRKNGAINISEHSFTYVAVICICSACFLSILIIGGVYLLK